MKSGYSKLSYALAIIAGFFVPLTAYLEPDPYAFIAICFFLGGLLGFFWPKESWRWGLWISAPSIVFILLSQVFSEQYNIFSEKDLPVLLYSISAGSLGSFLFALLANKPINNKS